MAPCTSCSYPPPIESYALSLHYRDARVYGRTTMVIHDIEYTCPPYDNNIKIVVINSRP